jgi:hypothetical protein
MSHTENHKTFRIKAPLATHFRAFTPEEIAAGDACRLTDCPSYLTGWKLRWDVLSEADRHLATHCGRAYRIDQEWIVFEPGQACFRAPDHRLRIDRPELFLVRDGRAPARVHDNADNWADDLHTHVDRIDTTRQRG